MAAIVVAVAVAVILAAVVIFSIRVTDSANIELEVLHENFHLGSESVQCRGCILAWKDPASVDETGLDVVERSK